MIRDVRKSTASLRTIEQKMYAKMAKNDAFFEKWKARTRVPTAPVALLSVKIPN